MSEYPKTIESKIIEKMPLLKCFVDPITTGKFVPSNCKIAWSLKNSHSEISPSLDLSFYLMSNSQIYETKSVSLSLSFLDLTCPDDCINPSQGICDKSTGICDCKPGFVGHNCTGNIKHYTYKKYWS